jgi:hypothetical protein
MKTKIIHNILTNEIQEIALNKEELESYNKIAEEELEIYNRLIAESEARATQKAALLDRLGITEDEAKLLLE